jgi:beta-lactamase class A
MGAGMLKELVLKAIDFEKMKSAFIIKNLKTGERASYNENEIVPAASLIKIHIMIEIIRQVKAGKLSLKQRISVTETDKVPFSILTMLETGNSYSINDLLTLMIVQSDNTAANLLIEIAGIAEINKLISDLNLKNTILRRKMMDIEARYAGRENLTTAQDSAWLMELLYRGEALDQESGAYMIDIMKKQLDTGMMRLYIPDETVVAHKSGELDHLSHEAGIVYHVNGDYIFVVLIWDAVTNNSARQSIGQISKIAYDYFNLDSASTFIF